MHISKVENNITRLGNLLPINCEARFASLNCCSAMLLSKINDFSINTISRSWTAG